MSEMTYPCGVASALRAKEAQDDRDQEIFDHAETLLDGIAEEFVCDEADLKTMLEDDGLSVLADAFANVDRAIHGDPIALQAVLRSVTRAKKWTLDIARDFERVTDRADEQAREAMA